MKKSLQNSSQVVWLLISYSIPRNLSLPVGKGGGNHLGHEDEPEGKV